jgi:hypothetical protein
MVKEVGTVEEKDTEERTKRKGKQEKTGGEKRKWNKIGLRKIFKKDK